MVGLSKPPARATVLSWTMILSGSSSSCGIVSSSILIVTFFRSSFVSSGTARLLTYSTPSVTSTLSPGLISVNALSDIGVFGSNNSLGDNVPSGLTYCTSPKFLTPEAKSNWLYIAVIYLKIFLKSSLATLENPWRFNSNGYPASSGLTLALGETSIKKLRLIGWPSQPALSLMSVSNCHKPFDNTCVLPLK